MKAFILLGVLCLVGLGSSLTCYKCKRSTITWTGQWDDQSRGGVKQMAGTEDGCEKTTDQMCDGVCVKADVSGTLKINNTDWTAMINSNELSCKPKQPGMDYSKCYTDTAQVQMMVEAEMPQQKGQTYTVTKANVCFCEKDKCFENTYKKDTSGATSIAASAAVLLVSMLMAL